MPGSARPRPGSRSAGRGADHAADDDLRDHREAHPLARVFPLLDDVLGQAARECDAMMAVSDAAGQLLWVCGNPSALRAAERSASSRAATGTSGWPAPTPRAWRWRSDRTATVIGAEHFRRVGAQLELRRDADPRPGTRQLLGVLDITGGDEIVVPQTMAMVRAAARLAEAELARDLLAPAGAATEPPTGLAPADRVARPQRVAGRPSTTGAAGSHAAAEPAAQRDPAAAGLRTARPVRRRARRAPLRGRRRRPRRCAPSSTGCGTCSATSCSPRVPTGWPRTVAGDWLAVGAQLAAGDVRRRDAGLPRPGAAAVDRARRRPAARRARRSRCVRPCCAPATPT